ncbi:hypothetical protein Acr_00g0051080 [Actinidia rufa]|uniref:Uncharacterized protein n=1 Tax=Actinidia rufa TaxID=165716 RepID=A0A7J0DLC7_9ERIC|nr:hypothetical protein Acr_00g0051080 [Actinidia rufa]
MPFSTFRHIGIPDNHMVKHPIIVSVGDEVMVEESKRPFDVSKAHFNEAMFFIKLSVKEPTITMKPRRVKIPHWEDIKDDKEEHSGLYQGKTKPMSAQVM